MAEAHSSKAIKEGEEEKEDKPNPPSSIPIPYRSSAKAISKEGSRRSSAAPETLTLTEQDSYCRSFSQLLAGAMASPAAAAANLVPAAVLEMKPTLVLTLAVDPARFPIVAQPAFIGVLAQFGMSHQEALASVTAQAQAQVQAQMQLQTGYSSSSLAIPTKSLTQPMLSALSPTPLQQRMPSVSEDNVSMAEMEQNTSSDQKAQPAHGIVRTPSSDAYNWRKYGQKQVKSSESSRSYYRCTNSNCVAKKKIQRCHDGHITEIIYKGQHNHEPPHKTRYKKENEALSGGPSGGNETGDLPGENLSESNPSMSRREQISGHTTPEPQLQCSSNCDGDAGTRERGDEPDPKRRIKDSTVSYSAPLLKTVKEPKVVVQTGSDPGSLGDGYRWRKYGQKIVKGNPNPRSYYKCSYVGCPVRKHVERASDDEKAHIITYEGKHSHDRPASKNSYDPPSTALIAAAPAPAPTGGQIKTSDLRPDEPTSTQSTDVEGKRADEKAQEGEKAMESAQTLLSIGLKNSSEEDGGAKNTNVIQRPLFNENSAAVSV